MSDLDLLYIPRPNTTGADHGAADGAPDLHADALEVGPRNLWCPVVGVGYVVSKQAALAAYRACLGHDFLLTSVTSDNFKTRNTGLFHMQARTHFKTVGKCGEDVAVEHLEGMGFRVIGRNIRYKTGEIDIVAKRGKELHFVEVKTRSSMRFQAPYESVTEDKKKRLKMAARLYLNDHRNNFRDRNLPPCIFSVISVDMSGLEPAVEVFLDAFE